jgi:hypothetical protein
VIQLSSVSNIWVILVFLMLFGILPLFAFPQSSLPSLSSRLLGGFVRILTIVTIGTSIWAKLGLFTWITAMMVYIVGMGIGWLHANQWQFTRAWQELKQKIALATVDIFDRGVSRQQFKEWLLLPGNVGVKIVRARLQQLQWSGPQFTIAIVPTIAILGVAILLRFEHPWTEYRYTHPDTYQQLLLTQQILTRNLPPSNDSPVFANLAAFLSVMSGIEAPRTVAILGAILGTIAVLSVGYAIKNLTKSGAAALAATYSLGIYLFTLNLPISNSWPPVWQGWVSILQDRLNDGLVRQWSISSLEFGAIVFILGLGFSTHLNKSRQRVEGMINTLACIALLTLTAPSLLILVPIAGFGIVFGRQMALFVVSIAWTLLALLAAIPDRSLPGLSGLLTTLPFGLALLFGTLFFGVATAMRLLIVDWAAAVCLTLLIAVTLNFFLPPPPKLTYLEYEISARKASEIGNFFPFQGWTIAAPVEQLAQVYGRGWYIDLAEFVDKYGNSVNKPGFQFPIKTPLFVFVENIPFGNDRPESIVPYSTLADPTYRNYRSISGRTKLLNNARDLCDTYLSYHPQDRIYYQDDRLKIYQFNPQQKA